MLFQLLQVIKPLNSIVGMSNSQHTLSLAYTQGGKKKNYLIGSLHFFFFLMYKNHIMYGFKPPKKL